MCGPEELSCARRAQPPASLRRQQQAARSNRRPIGPSLAFGPLVVLRRRSRAGRVGTTHATRRRFLPRSLVRHFTGTTNRPIPPRIVSRPIPDRSTDPAPSKTSNPPTPTGANASTERGDANARGDVRTPLIGRAGRRGSGRTKGRRRHHTRSSHGRGNGDAGPWYVRDGCMDCGCDRRELQSNRSAGRPDGLRFVSVGQATSKQAPADLGPNQSTHPPIHPFTNPPTRPPIHPPMPQAASWRWPPWSSSSSPSSCPVRAAPCGQPPICPPIPHLTTIPTHAPRHRVVRRRQARGLHRRDRGHLPGACNGPDRSHMRG